MDSFDFWAVWCDFEDAGLVDRSGGAQYRRVFAGWVAAGMPAEIAEWIAREGFDGGPGVVPTADQVKRRLDAAREV